MNNTTPEQLAKLPKWAQDRITLLERNLEHVSRRLEASFRPISKEDKDFRGIRMVAVSVFDYLEVPAKSIDFVTDKFVVTVRPEDDGSLDIHTYYMGEGRLVVMPDVTNCITLDVK